MTFWRTLSGPFHYSCSSSSMIRFVLSDKLCLPQFFITLDSNRFERISTLPIFDRAPNFERSKNLLLVQIFRIRFSLIFYKSEHSISIFKLNFQFFTIIPYSLVSIFPIFFFGTLQISRSILPIFSHFPEFPESLNRTSPSNFPFVPGARFRVSTAPAESGRRCWACPACPTTPGLRCLISRRHCRPIYQKRRSCSRRSRRRPRVIRIRPPPVSLNRRQRRTRSRGRLSARKSHLPTQRLRKILLSPWYPSRLSACSSWDWAWVCGQ